jgi:hypothetical protein
MFRLNQPMLDVQGARYKMPFVCCAQCGAAVAVLSQFDSGIAAKAARDGVERLERKMACIESDINQIRQDLLVRAR